MGGLRVPRFPGAAVHSREGRLSLLERLERQQQPPQQPTSVFQASALCGEQGPLPLLPCRLPSGSSKSVVPWKTCLPRTVYVNKILMGRGWGWSWHYSRTKNRLKIGIMETRVWISTMDSIKEPLVVSMPGPFSFQSTTGVREPLSAHTVPGG